MRSLRRHRRWLSGWLIAFMLFMQGATAAYACPQIAAALAAGAGAEPMAAMPDCDGDMAAMDPQLPQLCKAHCEADRQTVHSGTVVPDLPPAMAAGGAAVAAVLAPVQSAALTPALPASIGPPAGTPPLYLVLLVLRN
jgi:hypothetical protein